MRERITTILIPLHEIMRFHHNIDMFLDGLGCSSQYLVGNIIAFMPFGSFLPIYSKRCRNVWMTVLYSFELSLLVELLQLVFKVGSFDVDDLFLNTIGGLLGYLVYKGLLYLWKRYEKARHIVNK